MHHVEIFVLVAGAVAVTAACRRWGWPSPLVLVAVGLVVSFVPGVPRYEVDPELILEFVLPPLLYSAATESSYQDVRRYVGPILRLGVGLVLVSAFAVALVVWLLVDDLPFAVALVLGAVVAPPDAVAAAAVGRRLGLPRRVMSMLSGESLINDATSLTLYKVALAAVATGTAAFSGGAGVFALAVLVGVALGLGLGVVVHQARMRLDDPVVASAVGLLTPFAAYWSAEALGGSGVLAVVAAGLYLGHTSPRAGFATRLFQTPLWSTLVLPLEAFTFALIGLQLPWLIDDVRRSHEGLASAALVALAVLGTVLLVRPLYVLATGHVRRRRHAGATGERPADLLTARESAVVSWAGMRGVVTLAAAAAVPAEVDGEEFPYRASLQLVAYTVAIGTLLLQGLTLPWVIRRLGVGSQEEDARDASQEAELRVATAGAVRRVLEERAPEWARELGDEQAARLVQRLVGATTARAQAAAAMIDPEGGTRRGEDGDGASGRLLPAPLAGRRGQQLRRDLVRAQREVLVERRDAGELDETVMRRVLRELDLEDEALAASWVNRV
ncbi:cation:proton antiporter [Cellulomonas sp. NPDC055163]